MGCTPSVDSIGSTEVILEGWLEEEANGRREAVLKTEAKT